jgi:glycosyltransferase involved in cell wall biosynthesis
MNKKIAIVHDWFVGGGAEKVVQAIHELYPEAPIYTSYISDEWREKLKSADIRTGFLQRYPKLRKFLPLARQWWFSHLDLSEFDIIISSSGAEAKGVRKTRKEQIHINYCHAPTHYYWSRYNSYLKDPGFGKLNWLARLGLKILLGPARKWDYKAAQGPDVMIANSTHIQNEVKKYYGRESIVIHPPVDIDRFLVKSIQDRDGYVITGRQVPYKRIDLAIRACNELEKNLIVIGNGPEHKKLQSIAGKTIKFLTNVSDDELPGYLQNSSAFIFPGVDDFGIAPVEAMAAGCPVIAFKAGGALDTVKENVSGVFFNNQSVESLKDAMLDFERRRFSQDRIIAQAQLFSKDKFKKDLSEIIDQYSK